MAANYPAKTVHRPKRVQQLRRQARDVRPNWKEQPDMPTKCCRSTKPNILYSSGAKFLLIGGKPPIPVSANFARRGMKVLFVVYERNQISAAISPRP